MRDFGANDGTAHGAGYAVEQRDGCTLIRGVVTLERMASICTAAGPDAVLATDLAFLSDAVMAFGTQSAVDALVAKLRAAKLADARPQERFSGLSDAATEWFLAGEHGLAAATVFTRVTGIPHPYIRDEGVEPTSHPSDPSDLRRCRLLLDAAPELMQPFREIMPGVSPAWMALVANWDDLCSTMDRECPDWRAGKGGACRETYRKMQHATWSAG
jgi:hypothetical protein